MPLLQELSSILVCLCPCHKDLSLCLPCSSARHFPVAASHSLIRPGLLVSADTMSCPSAEHVRAHMLLLHPSRCLCTPVRPAEHHKLIHQAEFDSPSSVMHGCGNNVQAGVWSLQRALCGHGLTEHAIVSGECLSRFNELARAVAMRNVMYKAVSGT